MNGLTRGQVVLAVLLIVAAAAVLLGHFASSGFSCFWDTSTCASSTEKSGVYEGALLTQDGRPYRSSPFTVEFGSRAGEDDVPFRTDEEGRYCIHWADEETASVRGPDGVLLSNELGYTSLDGWRDLGGRDPPPGCQESFLGVPWSGAEDKESTWQYWLMALLPVAAILALIAALISWRAPRALFFLRSGAVLFAADLVALVIFWS